MWRIVVVMCESVVVFCGTVMVMCGSVVVIYSSEVLSRYAGQYCCQGLL